MKWDHRIPLVCEKKHNQLLFLFQLTAVCNGDSLPTHQNGMQHVHRLTTLGSQILQRLENVHSLLHLSENDVMAVEPRARNRRDEELRTVRVGSAVGHRQQTGTVVLQVEVLVRETLAVDRLTSHSISHREIASLDSTLTERSTWHMN